MIIRRNSQTSIDAEGGLIFFKKYAEEIGLSEAVESVLGKRCAQAKYSYTDVLQTFIYNTISGGTYLEDINNLRQKLNDKVPINLCSSDVVANVLFSLSNRHEEEIKEPHMLYFNSKLNDLLLNSYKLVGDAFEDGLRILDHDHTKLPNKKADARYSHKGMGYWLSALSSEQMPLYLSLQGGNSTPRSELQPVLEKGFKALQKHGIKYDCYRADGASYTKKTIQLVDSYFDHFLIRATKSNERIQQLIKEDKFEWVKIGKNNYVEAAEMEDTFAEIECRRIIYRHQIDTKADHQRKIFDQDNYRYYEIITNLPNRTPQQIIILYNQRGREEQLFDQLKNDFNASKMPFSYALYNLSYLCFCGIAKVLTAGFQAKINKLCGRLIGAKDRIKRLMRKVINIPARMVRTARYEYYNLYSKNPLLDPLIHWVNQ